MRKTAKILVTGGTGFLGSYVLRELLAAGYSSITAIYRSGSSFSLVEDIRDRIKWIQSDLQDVSTLKEILKECDAIVHSAALVSMSSRDRKTMIEVNVHGTAQLVDLAIDQGVSKFLYVSSASSLGPGIPGRNLSEKVVWNGKPPYSFYALTKFLAELEVFRGFAEGLNTVIINPSYILGAGLWNAGPTSLYKRVFDGLPAYPKGSNGVVDVRDVSRMISLLIARNDFNGERILCSNENISHRELISKIANLMGRRAPTVGIGSWMTALATVYSFISSLLGNKRSLITRESLRIASMDLNYDNSKSIEQLNFTYTPLPKTLRETCEAFLSTYPGGKKFGILPINK